MNRKHFGIDFGTTETASSYMNENLTPIVGSNSEGAFTTPSIVYFEDESEIVVGSVAKDYQVLEQYNTISMVKLLLGKSDYALSCNGKDKSPQEVTSCILRKICDDTSSELDTKVKDIIIACPSCLGQTGREALRESCSIAGINVVDIVSEAVAFSLYYHSLKKEDKTILIYDLGGGIFETTIIKFTGNVLEVICTEGNSFLGGVDWDSALADYLEMEFRAKTGLNEHLDESMRQEIVYKAEQTKRKLSHRETALVVLNLNGESLRVEITRDLFSQITLPLLEQTIEMTDIVIENAKQREINIDEIVLTGGSSRMPQVRQKIIERYHIDPIMADFVGGVAKGAAMWATEKYIVQGSQWSDAIQDYDMEEIKKFYADSKTYFTYDEYLDIYKHSSGFSEYLKRKNASADYTQTYTPTENKNVIVE